jgi:hypothetical protein
LSTPPISVAEFKARYVRDFPYNADGALGVTDADITAALADACLIFNSTLWGSVADQKTAFYPLAAHCLWSLMQASGGLAGDGGGQGLDAGGEGVVQSKSVGGMSVTFDVPDWVRRDALYSDLWRSKYGQIYVRAMKPRTPGAVFVLGGNEDAGLI